MTEAQFVEELPKAINISRLSVFRILREQPDYVDDILQNASLKAWRELKRFKGDSKFSTWFCRIAINEALMHRRTNKAARFESVESLLEVLEAGDYYGKTWGVSSKEVAIAANSFRDSICSKQPSPESLCITRDLLKKIISPKSPVSNPALILFEKYGWPQKDLSKLAGITENGIKARIYNAKDAARKQAERLGINGSRS